MKNYSTGLEALWAVLKFPVLCFGAFWTTFVIFGYFHVMPIFLNPEYENYWEDVIAYRIQAKNSKSVEEFYAAYDPQ